MKNEEDKSALKLQLWESPKLTELEVSETRLGFVNGSDGEGADEAEGDPPIS